MEDPGFVNVESDFDPSRKSLHPVQRGLVKDWDMLEALWKLMQDDIGLVSSDTTSVYFIILELHCLVFFKLNTVLSPATDHMCFVV